MCRRLQLKAAAALAVRLFALCLSPLLLASAPVETAKQGVAYQHFVDRDEPWSIHVIRIDRHNDEYQLITTMGNGSKIGLGSLTTQLRHIPKQAGTPVAAINGDFFSREGDEFAGDPRGLQIVRGELVSGPTARECLWMDTNGTLHVDEVKPKFAITWSNGDQSPFELNERAETTLFTPAASRSASGSMEFVLEAADPQNWLPLQAGEKYSARIQEIRRGGHTRIASGTMLLSVARLRPGSGAALARVGDVITISTETVPSLKGVKTAIGGGPALVRDSKAQPARVSKSRDRHPRSAVGWNKDYLFFVEVDGRQRVSNGMTLPELADFMLRLGCEDATNLDGGGSSEIWLNGRIMNSPCDGHERSTANSLVIVQKNPEVRE